MGFFLFMDPRRYSLEDNDVSNSILREIVPASVMPMSQWPSSGELFNVFPSLIVASIEGLCGRWAADLRTTAIWDSRCRRERPGGTRRDRRWTVKGGQALVKLPDPGSAAERTAKQVEVLDRR
jgi:hypothetical protein